MADRRDLGPYDAQGNPTAGTPVVNPYTTPDNATQAALPSLLAQAVADLESSGGMLEGRQPAGMVDKVYGQYPAFTKDYGSGALGIDNYARQILDNNPNATWGDFYPSYVLSTGNPARTSTVRDLQTQYPSAYTNLIKNGRVDLNTRLDSMLPESQQPGRLFAQRTQLAARKAEQPRQEPPTPEVAPPDAGQIQPTQPPPAAPVTPAGTSAASSPAVPSPARPGAAPTLPAEDTQGTEEPTTPDAVPPGGTPVLPPGYGTPGYLATAFGQSPIEQQMLARLAQMPALPHPTRTQLGLASIGGALGGMSPGAWYGGRPVGMSFSPQAAQLATQQLLYGPYNAQMNQWLQSMKAYETVADLQNKIESTRGLALDRQMKLVDGIIKNVMPGDYADPGTAQFFQSIGLQNLVQPDREGNYRYQGDPNQRIRAWRKLGYSKMLQGMDPNDPERPIVEALAESGDPFPTGFIGPMVKTPRIAIWEDPTTAEYFTMEGGQKHVLDPNDPDVRRGLANHTIQKIGMAGLTPSDRSLLPIAAVIAADPTRNLRGVLGPAAQNRARELAGRMNLPLGDPTRIELPPVMARVFADAPTYEAMVKEMPKVLDQQIQANRSIDIIRKNAAASEEAFKSGARSDSQKLNSWVNWLIDQGGISIGKAAPGINAGIELYDYTLLREYVRLAHNNGMSGGVLSNYALQEGQKLLNPNQSDKQHHEAIQAILADSQRIAGEMRQSVDDIRSGLTQLGMQAVSPQPPDPSDKDYSLSTAGSPEVDPNSVVGGKTATQAPQAPPQTQAAPQTGTPDKNTTMVDDIMNRGRATPVTGATVKPPPAQLTDEMKTAITAFLNDAIRRGVYKGPITNDVILKIAREKFGVQ